MRRPFDVSVGCSAVLHGALLAIGWALWSGEPVREPPPVNEPPAPSLARVEYVVYPPPPVVAPPPPPVEPPPPPVAEPSPPPKAKPVEKPAPVARKTEPPKPDAPAEPPKPDAPAAAEAAPALGDPAGAAPAVANGAGPVAPAGNGPPVGAGSPEGRAMAQGRSDARGADLRNVQRGYYRDLNQYMKRRYVYPRRARVAGIEGTVLVELVVDLEGRIVRSRIVKSSGHAILDEAALESVTRIEKVPPPPPGLSNRYHIPFEYRLQG